MVIAIIGILAGLLLPALAKGKSLSRQIQCTGAQRQLMLTWELYASDNAENLAANGHGIPGSDLTPRFWVGGDGHFFPQAYTNADFLVNPEYAGFASYLPTQKIYKCPEDKSIFKRGIPHTRPQIRSYAMNAYMGWESDPTELALDHRLFHKTGDMAFDSPSSLFVFQDTHPNSVCMPAFITYMPGTGVDGFYHYPSSLHRGGGTVSFADGHVEAHRWQDPRTLKRVTSGILGHWDRSPGNLDVQWLQDHATRPLTHWAAVSPYPDPD